MYSFVLQNWTSIAGISFTSVTQTEQDWLDLTPFQDIVAWVDVKEVSGSPVPQLFLETAPSKDERLFVAMAGAPFTMAVSAAVPPVPTVIQLLLGTAATPIAQYLRWRLQPQSVGGIWDVTFRILIAANAPGLQPDDESRQAMMMMGR